MTITRPTNLTLHDWADQLVLDIGVPVRLDGDDWQDWGARVLASVAALRSAPNPYGFDAWQDWAERLCGVAA